MNCKKGFLWLLGVSFLVLVMDTTAFAWPLPVQQHYRWRNDNGNETAATWKGNTDTQCYNHPIGETIRLRVCIANEATDQDLAMLNWAPGLHYSTNSSFTSPIQVPVTATTQAFEMVASAYITNGEATTNQLAGSGTWVAGKCVEDPSYESAAFTLGALYFTNMEYVIKPTNNALPSATYYFLVSDEDGDASDWDNLAVLTVQTDNALFFGCNF